MIIDSPQNDITSEKLEKLFESAAIGVLMVDEGGNIISTNPYLLKIFGYEKSDLIQKKIEVLIPHRFHHNHVNYRKEYVTKSTNRPMGVGLDLFATKKDGTEFPVEVSLSTHFLNQQKITLAFVSDISQFINDRRNILSLNDDLEKSIDNRTKELSRTLQVLSLVNEKLEVSLNNQKAILDNAKVMLFAMKKNGIIQFFNPEASRITGYLEEEVVGIHSPVLFFDPKEIEICKEELHQQYGTEFNNDFDVIKEKTSRNEMVGVECNYINKKGKKIPVSITITPIKNKNKEIVSFLGLAIDITDRKEAERNLMEALTKERKLGELKSRFVSMASHEFRTPLSTILSSAYLIEKYHDSSDQQKREKHLSRIISSVNNLTNILNEFLSVGKIDEGKIGIHITRFDLKALINEIINETKGMLKSNSSIAYTHEGSQYVCLDINLIKNIMLNLISNAIKFSNEDAVININTSIVNDEIIIMVKDNGIGISTEDQEHLMDRFFRGKNVSNIQGTGLGLHIVSKYVESLKGKIKYISQLNEGTTFTIFLNNLKINEHEDIITN